MKIENLDSMVVDNGSTEKRLHAPINPFMQDHYNMGTRLGNNIMIMHGNHDNEICKYLIIVDLITGERKKVTFDSVPMTGAEQDVANIINQIRGGAKI